MGIYGKNEGADRIRRQLRLSLFLLEVTWRFKSRFEKAARPVKHWQIIADNLKKAGFSVGWVSAFDAQGRKISVADANRH